MILARFFEAVLLYVAYTSGLSMITTSKFHLIDISWPQSAHAGDVSNRVPCLDKWCFIFSAIKIFKIYFQFY